MVKVKALVILSSIFLGALFLSFQVPTAESANFVGQTIYIRTDGSIEPMDAPIDVHGATYTLTGDIQCPRGARCIYIERSNILLDGYGYTIEGWEPQDNPSLSGIGIYVAEVSNVEIRNINVKGCVFGIEIQTASQVSIYNATIDGEFQPEKGYEADGVYLLNCDDVNVYQNKLLNNHVGILVLSSNCKISDNTIMDNAAAGVFLTGSSNTVESNLIARNDLGIEITSGSDNLIQSNDILNNKRIGALIIDSANNAFVGNNIVGQNETDAYGIQIGSYDGGNLFYHNDFENNYVHVEGGDSALSANLWDNGYPSGGNYWDTYESVDNYKGFAQNETGSDGIGDILYQITAANVDRYPLMQPVRLNPDINEETIAPNDYMLAIMIIIIIVVCVIISLIIIYWRKRNMETRKEEIPFPTP
jgi:parallel beta-helix repeat protein